MGLEVSETMVSSGFPKIKARRLKLYHGSVKPVASFKAGIGAPGRYGAGLYLSPDLDIARYHAEGGRQGGASQKLNAPGSGHVYEFTFSGTVLEVIDENEAMRELVGEYNPAGEAFRNVGDLESPKVTKHFGAWAKEAFDAQAVWMNEKGSVGSPLNQVLVLDFNCLSKPRELRELAESKMKNKDDAAKLLAEAGIKVVAGKIAMVDAKRAVEMLATAGSLEELERKIRGESGGNAWTDSHLFEDVDKYIVDSLIAGDREGAKKALKLVDLLMGEDSGQPVTDAELDEYVEAGGLLK